MIKIAANLLKLAEQQNACWKGYTQVGMKMKGGREVPNCVPAGGVPKPKAKKKTEKKAFDLSEDPWLNAGLGAVLGAIAGNVIGGISPDRLENPTKGILSPNWSQNEFGSGAGKVLGSLGGGLTGYMLTPKKKTKTKKKTQKKSAVSSSESIVDVPVRCTPGFGCKRLLTPQERLEVEAAKRQMFPDILATEADPISSQMSSPAWASIGTGALGALLGGGVGAGAGALSGIGAIPAGAGGAALGALLGGIYGHHSRSRQNRLIEDTMEDLPVGADIGDIELYSNPQFRQALARDFQRQLIRKGLM